MNYLGEDEEIAYQLRPHWRTLIVPALLLLAIAAAVGFTLSSLTGTSLGRTILRWMVFGVCLVVLLWWVIRPFVNWLATSYVLTDRRIIVRAGVFRRTGRDMPLARVNDVSFEATLMDRLFRSGTIMVESGSEQGQLIIHDVPMVERVQREIYRLHEEDDARRRGIQPS